MRNERGVREKFGVGPESIPDYLALVGDAADGFPGVPRWGAKSAGTVLGHYEHLDAIPHDNSQWQVAVRGAAGLSASLRENWENALLFRELATLRTDADMFGDIDALKWNGPTGEFAPLCEQLGAPELAERATRLAP